MKSSYVKDLKTNDRVRDIFYVAEKRIQFAKTGKPYVRLRLEDRTGSIWSLKWDIDPDTFDIFEGDFILIEGLVEEYQGDKQIKFTYCKKYTDKLDPTDFLPKTDKNIDQLFESLYAIASSVQDKDLSRLLAVFLNDNDFVEQFKHAPAGCSIHHGYIGGLLEHTVSVATLADAIASHYPKINRDILVTGAILHDIGKIDEISWTKTIEFTDLGHFIGHVAAGALKIEKAIESIPGFDHEKRLQFLHLMLSHHGKREYGAPILPGTREAIVLHYIEDMDAKVKMFDEAIEEESGTAKWTRQHKQLERSLYRMSVSTNAPLTTENNGFLELEVDTEDPFADL